MSAVREPPMTLQEKLTQLMAWAVDDPALFIEEILQPKLAPRWTRPRLRGDR